MKQSSVLLLVFLAACTGDDDPGVIADAAAIVDANPNAPDANTSQADADPAAPDATPRMFANHIIHSDCGPADGPALRLLMTNDDINDTTCRPVGGTAPSVEITIYTRSITAPQTITFGPGGPGTTGGSGTHCLGGAAPCRVTQSGTLHFDTYLPGGAATGTWTLDFNGTIETGRFEAEYCDLVTICG